MSWSDYGVPDTMNARNWMNALTDATNERFMQGVDPWPLIEYPGRLVRPNQTYQWKLELMSRIIGRQDYVNLNEFNPLDYAGKPWEDIVPLWKSRDQLLEYLGEEEYDIDGHNFYPKYDRRFFEQQYRMLNELTVVFPTVTPYNSFYGGTIRKRTITYEALGATVKEAFQSANHAPDSYENANWYGYSQPGTHVSGNKIYYQVPGDYRGNLEFSQIVVDVVWPMEAEISVWFYTRMGDPFYGRRFPPWVRKARLVNGHAEIETLTTEIFDSLIADLKEDEYEFNVYALGCLFDFKTENGFQFLKEEDNSGTTH